MVHKFPPNVSAPVCSVCGGELPKDFLTEKNLAYAEKFGVRCEACDGKKREGMEKLKARLKSKVERDSYFAKVQAR